MRPGAVDQVSEFRSQVTQSTYQPFELKIRKDKFVKINLDCEETTRVKIYYYPYKISFSLFILKKK